MYGFFNTIPKELDEAAKIDGAGHARIFFTIILRLVASILVVLGLLSFIGIVNEYVIASVMLIDPNQQTVAIAFQFVSGFQSQNPGHLLGGRDLAALPVMVIFLFSQKYIAAVWSRAASSSGCACLAPPRRLTAVRLQYGRPPLVTVRCACASPPATDRRGAHLARTPTANRWTTSSSSAAPIMGLVAGRGARANPRRLPLAAAARGRSRAVAESASACTTSRRWMPRDFALVAYLAPPAWMSTR